MCTVSEAELTEAMMLLLERSKLLVEGAGAAPLAALLSGRLPLKGRKTVLVVSGGNVDLGRLAGLTASRNLVS
ncbi:hypothetical protein N6H14_29605 [Paenibacillus sp. CC-CFT747]|nr:hypothetical protein N6H14_29605 [Paenibacillus sp. CC-CFT747]